MRNLYILLVTIMYQKVINVIVNDSGSYTLHENEVVLKGGDPIRGRRQIKAIYYFFRCLVRGNFPCARRELEIISGKAKTYSVILAPSFFESVKCLDEEMTNEEYDSMVDGIREHFKGMVNVDGKKNAKISIDKALEGGNKDE